MRLSVDEFRNLASVFLKQAQAVEEAKQDEKKKKTKRRKPILPSAFPDYSRSLVTQTRTHPVAGGIGRGLSAGTLGAILGALGTRVATEDPKKIGVGAGLSGLLGALAGYYSGSREAESDYSRLLFLRRLGIDRPGELEALLRYPETTKEITEEGMKI